MDIFNNNSLRRRSDDDELGWLDLFSSDEPILPTADYSNEGRNYPTIGSTSDSPINITTDIGTGAREQATLDPVGAGKGVLDRLLKSFNIPGTDQLDLARLLLVALSGAAGYKGAKEPSGGGATEVFTPGATRKFVTTQGTYGPIAKLRNAAGGGIMNAYAAGGPVAMEDGGFVMTKKAVDGAGGPQGIQSLLPGARPIRGPGTGTSDSIPAYIQGRNSVTPARVSNGEAYVPKDTVDQAGGAKRLYGLMHALQRRA